MAYLFLPMAVAGATIVLGLIARGIVFRTFRQRAIAGGGQFNAVFIKAFRSPIAIWILMLAIHLGPKTFSLSGRAQNTIARTLLVLFILSVTLALSRLAGLFIRALRAIVYQSCRKPGAYCRSCDWHGHRVGYAWCFDLADPDEIALGVGGIAVALALQDTLSNLFSGFYVSVAGQVHIGDYIKLDSGEEGYITDITWRSTFLRSLQNNVIIIPNSKMGKATITNYNLPEQAMSVSIAVSVSYDCNPLNVEEALMGIARKAAGDVPGLRSDPAPSVRLLQVLERRHWISPSVSLSINLPTSTSFNTNSENAPLPLCVMRIWRFPIQLARFACSRPI